MEPRTATRRDHHVHTCWSDGLPTPAEVVDRASDLGLEVVATTDHYPAMHRSWRSGGDSPLLGPAGLKPPSPPPSVLDAYLDEAWSLKGAAEEAGVKLLVGLEWNSNAEFDLTDQQVRRLDVLLVEGLWGDRRRFFSDVLPVVARVRKAMGGGFPVVLAHPHFSPGLQSLAGRVAGQPDDDGATLSTIERASLLVELNASYRAWEKDGEREFYDLLVDSSDVRFTLGSDAHSLADLGRVDSGWQYLLRRGAEGRLASWPAW